MRLATDMTIVSPNQQVIEWLLSGDPSIQWQTMRDLTALGESTWSSARRVVIEHGWCRQHLDSLEDGSWDGEKWTSSLWTLIALIDMGIPADHPPARAAALRFLEPMLTDPRIWGDVQLFKRTSLFSNIDLCHIGFWLRIGIYFGADPEPLTRLAQIALDFQMPDGGWNCRSQRLPKTHHSSFNTTFNILEGIRPAAELGLIANKQFEMAESRAIEFMLEHRLYRSDRTGEVVKEAFERLTFPYYYHYTYFRGLDYMRTTPAIHDRRLDDPIEKLMAAQTPSGRWQLGPKISGKTRFSMESEGTDSRWITLQALRVLAARQT